MNDQALKQCVLFDGLSVEELDLLCGQGRRYTVPEKHVFFDMGESNDSMFVNSIVAPVASAKG